jgi:hypothetical protein
LNTHIEHYTRRHVQPTDYNSTNMLSLALRLIAITLSLFGIIACAQISAAVFENSIRNPELIDTEKMSAKVESPSSVRPTLRIDTSVADTNNHVILEVFPQRPRAFSLNAFSSKVVQLMTSVLSTVDLGSRRARRIQQGRVAPAQQRWAHIECSV